jgi:hypothetical protein
MSDWFKFDETFPLLKRREKWRDCLEGSTGERELPFFRPSAQSDCEPLNLIEMLFSFEIKSSTLTPHHHQVITALILVTCQPRTTEAEASGANPKD